MAERQGQTLSNFKSGFSTKSFINGRNRNKNSEESDPLVFIIQYKVVKRQFITF